MDNPFLKRLNRMGGLAGNWAGALTDPAAAFDDLKGMADRAYNDSATAFPDQGYAYSQRDAMRHGLMMGQVSQKYGKPAALGLGAAWEAFDPGNWKQRDVPDIVMDLHNNAQGAQAGAQSMSYDELRASIEDMSRSAQQKELGLMGYIREQPTDMIYLQNSGRRER